MTAAKPDIVYLPDDNSVANAVMVQAKARGIKAPFIGGDEWDPSVFDMSSADGGYFTTHYFPGGPLESAQNFMKAFDAMNLLLTAIQNAGSDDLDKVKAVLEGITFEAVTGRITFNAQHNPLKDVLVLKVTGEGFALNSFVSR